MASSDEHRDHSSSTDRLVPVRIETSFVEERPEPASILRLLNIILRRRWIVAVLPVALATIVCTFTLLRARTWTSSASFVPSGAQAGGDLGRFSGLAAQFGIGLPGAMSGESPEFYQALLESGQLRRMAARTEYRIVDETEPDTTWTVGNLVNFFRIRGRTEPIRLDRAAEILGRRLTVSTSPETGQVRLAVRTKRPELSAQIVDRLIALVNEFNLETRQSQAEAEREFVERRLAAGRGNLRSAENVLQRFLQENRRIEDSSELRFERDRIQRNINVLQEVVLSLSQALEQARIEEVRNTPVITVVEAPFQPVRPDRLRLIAKGLISLATGLFLGIAGAFMLEFFADSRERDPDEYREFRKLTTESRDDLRSLRRRLLGRLSRKPAEP